CHLHALPIQLARRFRAASRRRQATQGEVNATRCVGSMECPESRNCAVDPSRTESVYSNSEPLDRVPPRLRRRPKCPDKQTSEASLPSGQNRDNTKPMTVRPMAIKAWFTGTGAPVACATLLVPHSAVHRCARPDVIVT